MRRGGYCFIWLGLALFGCGEEADEAPTGSWSGACEGTVGSAAEGTSMGVELKGMRLLDAENTNTGGDFDTYRGTASLDGVDGLEAKLWHCRSADGCRIGDDSYEQDGVLVSVGEPPRKPSSAFFWMTWTDDGLEGTCTIVPAGGVGFIHGGTLQLSR